MAAATFGEHWIGCSMCTGSLPTLDPMVVPVEVRDQIVADFCTEGRRLYEAQATGPAFFADGPPDPVPGSTFSNLRTAAAFASVADLKAAGIETPALDRLRAVSWSTGECGLRGCAGHPRELPPMMILRAPAVSDEQRERMLRVIRSLGVEGVVPLDGGVDVRLLEPAPPSSTFANASAEPITIDGIKAAVERLRAIPCGDGTLGDVIDEVRRAREAETLMPRNEFKFSKAGVSIGGVPLRGLAEIRYMPAAPAQHFRPGELAVERRGYAFSATYTLDEDAADQLRAMLERPRFRLPPPMEVYDRVTGRFEVVPPRAQLAWWPLDYVATLPRYWQRAALWARRRRNRQRRRNAR